MLKLFFLVAFFVIVSLWVCWDRYMLSSFATQTMVLWLKGEVAGRSNPHLFGYKLTPDTHECNHAGGLRTLILVTSYVGNEDLRQIHRQSMPAEYLRQHNASRIFLLGEIPDSVRNITQEAIRNESRVYGDILQGSFMDSKRNLTYKHLMGLDWASKHCEKAEFVLKIDDDTVFLMDTVNRALDHNANASKSDLLQGFVLNGSLSGVEKTNTLVGTTEQTPTKEKLSNRLNTSDLSNDLITIDYPQDVSNNLDDYDNDAKIDNNISTVTHTSYVSGWMYITTTQVSAKIVAESSKYVYVSADDVFVTGIVRQSLKIELTELRTTVMAWTADLLEFCLKEMNKSNALCDAVATNEGKTELLLELNEAAKNCTSCKPRSDEEVEELWREYLSSK